MAEQRPEGQSYLDLGKSRRTGAVGLVADAIAGVFANVGNVETTVQTVTLPPGTLNANNQAIRIRGGWLAASNGNAKRLRMYFGATVVFDTLSRTDNGLVGYFGTEVFRISSTSQAGLGFGIVGTNIIAPVLTGPAETLGGAGAGIVVKATALGVTTGDISLLSWTVEWIPNGGIQSASGVLL